MLLRGYSRRNKKQIEEYIRKQLREDYVADRLTMFGEVYPFTGVILIFIVM